MKKLLVLFCFAATTAFAQTSPEVFPSDYKPSPCAPPTDAICKTWDRGDFELLGAKLRGFTIDQSWVDAHWDEMLGQFRPLCAKIATCMTVPGNDPVYCVDLMRDAFPATCDRYEKGTNDHYQCVMSSVMYFIGIQLNKPLWNEAQECAKQNAVAGVRTLSAAIDPPVLPLDYNGKMRVQVYDAETHVPVRARLSVDAGHAKSSEGPVPNAFYMFEWKPVFKRVPNADGHTDLAVPVVTIEADGYAPLTLTMPMTVPKAIVEMTPSKLKPGKNTVTITARDAATGAPVEMRVMAGDEVVGETNKPFTLGVTRKHPEIWVTSLFDRYGDAVVLRAKQ